MASSSTSPIHKSYQYDVFLSFRGEDTRKNFVDHLYDALERQGIRTFKDDEKLEKGKRISEELLKSIEDSQFFIIVFSKNYASSSWCLDELVKIMECHNPTDQIAYPVFYDVEPSEIRKQSGLVEEAFAKLNNEHDAEKWRDALKQAANLAGWDLRNTADGHEAKVIKLIVEQISLELRSIDFSVDTKLVGMESRIKQAESSLEIGFEDVRTIGIKGIGGGGKTTLAKAAFNKICIQFDGRSFVENVREVSKASLSGLKMLQEKVLSDVLNEKEIKLSSVDDGKTMMKKRLRSKKVLVVLDDVDCIDQLEALAGEPSWFKPGSRIIITTREEQVLIAHRVNLICDVNLLSDAEAICLFSRYAFGREIPIKGYEELSRQVVRYAAGLPLTIRVLGSFLCGKIELEWKDALERLKKIPLKETLEKLELSYIGLEDDYKEIFLDIACFLKGSTKEKAIRILESCGFHAITGLRVLEQKSLINILNGGYLGMHDHIEEMGRNIVRRKHPDEPEKHSRLWIREEIEYLLANDLGTKATRCIKADMRRFSPETFMKGLRSMKKLRLLHVYVGDPGCSNWKFEEVSQYLPNSLQYLNLPNYPFQSLPNTFQANNLISLEMKNSNIIQLWEGGERKVLNNLKYLDLSFSKLKKTNLQLTPNLEVLNLTNCYDLEELHMPIKYGCLKLTYLKLNSFKLRTLDLRLTPKLQQLYLEGCDELVELHMPVNYGCPNLTYIRITGSKLSTLDLRLTPNLQQLYLDACVELEEVHMPIGCPALSSLHIYTSKLKAIDLGLCYKLKEICLSGCYDLLDLHMPVDYGCPNLTYIRLTCLKLSTLDLRLTPNLEKLYLDECVELVELHMPIGCPALSSLRIYHSKLKTIDLGLCYKLKEIHLSGCYDLLEFHMPVNYGCPNLTYIKLTCLKLSTLDLRLSPNLQYLYLEGCDELVELHMSIGCPKLVSLYLNLSKLRTLNLRLSPSTKDLHISGYLKELAYLHLSGCSVFKSFYLMTTRVSHEFLLTAESNHFFPLDSEPGLQKFQLSCVFEEQVISSTKDLQKIISLGLCLWTDFTNLSSSICGLPHLRELTLNGGISAAPQDLDQLESLEKLYLLSTEIKHLPDSICMLKHLKSLKLESRMHLEKLPQNLGQLKCLEKLHLECTCIKHLPDSICLLKRLKYLELESCWHLEKLPDDLGRLESLQELIISDCINLRDIPNSTCNIKCLECFRLRYCISLEKLPEEIGHIECLKELDIEGTEISHLPQSIFMFKGRRIVGSRWLLESSGFASDEIQTSGDETFCCVQQPTQAHREKKSLLVCCSDDSEMFQRPKKQKRKTIHKEPL